MSISQRSAKVSSSTTIMNNFFATARQERLLTHHIDLEGDRLIHQRQALLSLVFKKYLPKAQVAGQVTWTGWRSKAILKTDNSEEGLVDHRSILLRSFCS